MLFLILFQNQIRLQYASGYLGQYHKVRILLAVLVSLLVYILYIQFFKFHPQYLNQYATYRLYYLRGNKLAHYL